jgi:DNA-binding CsgD family transcriptional regulator
MRRLTDTGRDSIRTSVAAALHAQGLLAGDAVHMKAALEIARKSPRVLVRADVEAGYGALLLAESAQGPGIAALDNARNLYHSVGAIGETQRVDRLLRSFGIRRRAFSTSGKRPSEGWEALTEIEKRVARLIADGYTNRGVAAELVLSPNTIGTHVRSIFGKLRVNSRVQNDSRRLGETVSLR